LTDSVRWVRRSWVQWGPWRGPAYRGVPSLRYSATTKCAENTTLGRPIRVLVLQPPPVGAIAW